jgi:predicted unusual protein kinase regulating ubiquinone biosynthesis (AarF/ABC1/UbiB family)
LQSTLQVLEDQISVVEAVDSGDFEFPGTEIIKEKQRIMMEVFRKSQVDTQIVINGMRQEIKSLRTMVDKIPRIKQDLDNLYNRYKDIRDENNIFREIGILRNNSLKSE